MHDSSIDRVSHGLTGTSTRRQALKLLGGGIIGGAMAGIGLVIPEEAAAQSATEGTAALFDTPGEPLGTVSDLAATLTEAGDIDITGAFADADGNVTGFMASLIDATGSCAVLDLVLGPLDLHVLGHMAHFDDAHLSITAADGSGYRLGNLLCASDALVRDGVASTDLARLLNQIFAMLR